MNVQILGRDVVGFFSFRKVNLLFPSHWQDMTVLLVNVLKILWGFTFMLGWGGVPKRLLRKHWLRKLFAYNIRKRWEKFHFDLHKLLFSVLFPTWGGGRLPNKDILRLSYTYVPPRHCRVRVLKKDTTASSCVIYHSLFVFNSVISHFFWNTFRRSRIGHCEVCVPLRLYQIRKAILVEDNSYRSTSASILLKKRKNIKIIE